MFFFHIIHSSVTLTWRSGEEVEGINRGARRIENTGEVENKMIPFGGIEIIEAEVRAP